MAEITKIKSISLDIDGKEIELTIKQAKKLTVALKELFDPKTIINYPTYPVVIQRPYYHPEPYEWYPTITYCSDNTSWTSDKAGLDFTIQDQNLCIGVAE